MVKACVVFACPEPVAYRGRCRRHGAQVDQLRSVGSDRQAGKALYASARWSALRKYLFARQPTCPCSECAQTGRVRLCEVVHHLRPHGGDPVLFFDVANLQPLAKLCHDRITRGESFAGTARLPETAVPCSSRGRRLSLGGAVTKTGVSGG